MMNVKRLVTLAFLVLKFTIITTKSITTKSSSIDLQISEMVASQNNSKMRFYKESCDTSAECDTNLICYQSKCLCPLQQMYYKFEDHLPTHSLGMCIYFEQALKCNDDISCQDIDQNVFCNPESSSCTCKSGFHLDFETKACVLKTKSEQELLEKTRIKKEILNLLKTSKIFIQQSDCTEHADCSGEFSYCHNSKCECWPEYEFKITEQMDKITFLGKCKRKTCWQDSDCQNINHDGDDDDVDEATKNMICNNTLCQCAKGFVRIRETHHCQRIKLTLKRQSCDTTCKVVGGLFANIFILTLLYWCYHCCCAVFKNFRKTGNIRPVAISQSTYFMPMRSSIRDDGRHQSLTGSLLNFFMRFDKPPSYDEADITQEMHEILPSYNSVLKLDQFVQPFDYNDDGHIDYDHNHGPKKNPDQQPTKLVDQDKSLRL